MDLKSLRDDLASLRSGLRVTTEKTSKTEVWKLLDKQDAEAIEVGVEDVEELLSFLDSDELDELFLEGEVAPLQPRVTALVYELAALSKDIEIVVARADFARLQPVKEISDPVVDRLRRLAEEWRFRADESFSAMSDNLRSSQDRPEKAQADKESADAARLKAEEMLATRTGSSSNEQLAETGTPYDVKEILSAAKPLDKSKYRTDHSTLSPQQRAQRESLDFRDPEVNYTVEEWKEKLDKYVTVHTYMARDGYYLKRS